MTSNQKEQIKLLRLKGVRFTEIAQILGLSVNTIKSHCRRNENVLTCLDCGKEILVVGKAKPRKFCSDACRYAWWEKHQEQMQHREAYTFTCGHCKEKFTLHRNRQRKYCSRECYVLARYQKAGGTDE